MESAKDFIEYYFNGQLHLQGELEKLLSERDAAIRKECAGRGVKWAMMALGPLIMNSETRDELSAAIMGDTHE